MGLSNCMFCMADAMDVASKSPIHIGMVWSPSSDFKMTMGVLDAGSIANPATVTLCSNGIFPFPVVKHLSMNNRSAPE